MKKTSKYAVLIVFILFAAILSGAASPEPADEDGLSAGDLIVAAAGVTAALAAVLLIGSIPKRTVKRPEERSAPDDEAPEERLSPDDEAPEDLWRCPGCGRTTGGLYCGGCGRYRFMEEPVTPAAGAPGGMKSSFGGPPAGDEGVCAPPELRRTYPKRWESPGGIKRVPLRGAENGDRGVKT